MFLDGFWAMLLNGRFGCRHMLEIAGSLVGQISNHCHLTFKMETAPLARQRLQLYPDDSGGETRIHVRLIDDSQPKLDPLHHLSRHTHAGNMVAFDEDGWKYSIEGGALNHIRVDRSGAVTFMANGTERTFTPEMMAKLWGMVADPVVVAAPAGPRLTPISMAPLRDWKPPQLPPPLSPAVTLAVPAASDAPAAPVTLPPPSSPSPRIPLVPPTS